MVAITTVVVAVTTVVVAVAVVDVAAVDDVVAPGPVQWLGAVVELGAWPGMSTVPAHPKFESGAVRVMLLPSEKVDTTMLAKFESELLPTPRAFGSCRSRRLRTPRRSYRWYPP